jgi:hypothetical protein
LESAANRHLEEVGYLPWEYLLSMMFPRAEAQDPDAPRAASEAPSRALSFYSERQKNSEFSAGG